MDAEQEAIMAMRRRLTALMRKAGLNVETDVLAADLLATIIKRISTKREYEDVFGEGDGAEKFARMHDLDARQERILLEMQRVKDIFVPNPILDGVLTVLFVLEVAYVLYSMYAMGYSLYFVAVLFGIDAVVHRVKSLSETWGKRASAAIVRAGITGEDPLSGKIQTKKWQEQSWQLFIHVGFTAMELVLLSDPKATFWDDPRTCWFPHPKDQASEHSQLFAFYYLAQLGVWIYTCWVHRFVDERRKDYFVMYIHHVVTIALVGTSWAYGYWRIGLIVLFVHDISDIFVDALKMVNYLKLEGRKAYFASEIAYVLCVVSWAYWRLYEYPFRVLKGSYLDAWSTVSAFPSAATVPTLFGRFPLTSSPDLPMYVEQNVLLFTLQALHIYWFHLFAMIGYRIMTESVREASRQEYEGDSDGGNEGPPSLADAVADEPGAGESGAGGGGQRGAKGAGKAGAKKGPSSPPAAAAAASPPPPPAAGRGSVSKKRS